MWKATITVTQPNDPDVVDVVSPKVAVVSDQVAKELAEKLRATNSALSLQVAFPTTQLGELRATYKVLLHSKDANIGD